MSGSGLTVTVVGWAATRPREISGDGVPYTSFRLATTPRWFDSRAGAWTDGRTEWITVKAFRDVALNVGSSIQKGDPVLATGRLRTEEWEGENGPRTSLVLDVTALGHDLTRGRAVFVRRVNVAADAARGAGPGTDGADSGATSRSAGAAGGPADDDPWATGRGLDGLEDDELAEESDDDLDEEDGGASGERPAGAGPALAAAGSGSGSGTP